MLARKCKDYYKKLCAKAKNYELQQYDKNDICGIDSTCADVVVFLQETLFAVAFVEARIIFAHRRFGITRRIAEAALVDI